MSSFESKSDEPKPRRAVAVALQNDGGTVPKVVATGYGELARKILDIAFASGVKVREDSDLAEMLAAVDIDSPIPLNCFEAVAEILNYLYLANNARVPELKR